MTMTGAATRKDISSLASDKFTAWKVILKLRI